MRNLERATYAGLGLAIGLTTGGWKERQVDNLTLVDCPYGPGRNSITLTLYKDEPHYIGGWKGFGAELYRPPLAVTLREGGVVDLGGAITTQDQAIVYNSNNIDFRMQIIKPSEETPNWTDLNIEATCHP